MNPNPELAQKIVDFLNELVKIDPEAIEGLIKARVSCNEALANHGTVQVSSFRGTPGDPYRVGMLGILNGLAGSFDGGPKAGWGLVGAIFDDEYGTGTLKLRSFELVKNSD